MTVTGISWLELLDRVPELGVLETEALVARCQCDTDWRRWSQITVALRQLVGYEAEGSGSYVGSQSAYDAAYAHMLAIWEGDV